MTLTFLADGMLAELLDRFDRELKVEYRGEIYRVRDNGAVYRQCKTGPRKRKLDEVWTFGRPNASTGYMHVGPEVVHRIVATAFYGEQPSEKHIVDHIDTNRRNNRADNLRWITRLENLLLNPITQRRIIIAYGSLENFFKNPAAADLKSTKNFEWMRTVSKEEARESRDRLLRWADADQIPKAGLLGEWVYGVRQPAEPVVEEIKDMPSLTPMAIQRNWKTPCEFPACPDEITAAPLYAYASRLKFGMVFARNSYCHSLAVVAEEGDQLVSVLCNLADNSIKEWALTKVTIEDGKFVHESMGTYFTLQGALKDHSKQAGVPFEETIDDYA